jgi:hypothetical protein
VIIISFRSEGAWTVAVAIVIITVGIPKEHFADCEVMGLNMGL